MLRWAVIFLVLAIGSGIFGFVGIAGGAVWVAQALFIIFLVLFIIFLALGRRPPG